MRFCDKNTSVLNPALASIAICMLCTDARFILLITGLLALFVEISILLGGIDININFNTCREEDLKEREHKKMGLLWFSTF